MPRRGTTGHERLFQESPPCPSGTPPQMKKGLRWRKLRGEGPSEEGRDPLVR